MISRVVRLAVGGFLVFGVLGIALPKADQKKAEPAKTEPAKAESDEAIIKRQSQEFSDASASGDPAALAKLLDDDVTFMSDGGELSTKQEVVESAHPAPAGIKNKLVQGDWTFHQYGTTAVTSFTDTSTLQIFGQNVQSQYRSTEVWHQDHGKWKMISSQTMPLAVDPPAIELTGGLLDQYVGRYQASPDYIVKISRNDNGLTMQSGTADPIEMKAEVADVFFVAGQPRLRRIFKRDSSGKVVGLVSRREGHDLVLTRIS